MPSGRRLEANSMMRLLLHRSGFLLIVWLLIVEMSRAEGAEPITVTDVFTAGVEGYHTFRIPALIVTPRGALLAFCEGRRTSRADHGDVDLVLKRSTDGGKTWGPLQRVHDKGGDAKITIGNPCPVVDRDTATIWLPFTRNNNDVFVTHSVDDGKTWSQATKITEAVKKPEWIWYATGPGVGLQLRHRAHKGRLVIACDHKVKSEGRAVTYSHVIISDDHGRTWKLGGSVAPNTNECQAAELADGTLLMNMRNYWGSDGNNPVRGKMRAVARSTDGGTTWGALRFDRALVEPVCQASLLSYTAMDTDDRNRLLFANPASADERHRLTVRLSYDEGKTWPIGKVLEDGPSAYSCLAEFPDRSIGCLYERGRKDAYEKISLARFTLAWLTDGKDRLVGRPQIVGHRGLFKHAPENTLSNMRACLELRIGIELDVRRSKDRQLIVLHDATLDRTTSGTGKAADFTLAELKKLEAGSWFDPAFKDERIPTLDEVFALRAKYPEVAGLIAVDLKEADTEEDIVTLAQKYGILDRLLFIGRAITSADVAGGFGNPTRRHTLHAWQPRRESMLP